MSYFAVTVQSHYASEVREVRAPNAGNARWRALQQMQEMHPEAQLWVSDVRPHPLRPEGDQQ